ncbi:MAG: hypothetical protein GX308_07880 [Epulopiscium sp.]|nr:hypothetical protein [Candidatus Epulonipiscium sp.]
MMKNIDERLKSFRGDMDTLMENMAPSESLKNQVKICTSMEIVSNKSRKRRLVLAASFMCFMLIISIFQVPVVRAQVFSTLSNVVTWVRETTNLPIYLPESWQPIKQDIAETNKGGQNYYYELTGNEDFYSINVYKVNVPVKFNDRNDLLDKNGPVSQSDFVGAINGEKIVSTTPDLINDIPKDAESFELIHGIKAYEKDQGTALWWEHKEWNFEFRGSSLSHEALKELATAWDKAEIKISQTGEVVIIGGNKLTFDYVWNKDGYRYTYKTSSLDFKQTIDILNSFSRVDTL